MKNKKFKMGFSFNFNVLLFIFLFSINIKSQDLKQELTIPFPDTMNLDDTSEKNKKTKIETILPKISKEKTPEKKFINIPFPTDAVDKKITETKPKDKIPEITTMESEAKTVTVENELPLEKLFVYPELEILDTTIPEKQPAPESETKNKKPISNQEEKSIPKKEIAIEELKTAKEESKKVSPKTTNEIGKALTENANKPTKSSKEENSNLSDSKVTGLGNYTEKDSTPKSKIEKKKVSAKKISKPVKVDSKKAEVASTTPVTNLPNLEKPNLKKGKGKDKADESGPPYERSKYYLNRDDKPSASPELNAASSSDGEKSNLAKMDQIRLLSMERKKNEAMNIIEGISEPDFKFKGLYELAVGLENSAKGNKKKKEEAIPLLLKIITESPKTDPIVPKSLWALSHLLFSIGDHTPALDHLSDIILNHSNSEFADDAIYLSGRIYEESPSIRNLNRAKKYYNLFMQNLEKKHFKNSLYFPFVKKRLELLEN